ncbi:hypothetical protein RGAI101_3865 [Roseobacter sp. GAI101]|nr:hypothetical protein RGAI101_3865 [Roseobacter sp. GAI101]
MTGVPLDICQSSGTGFLKDLTAWCGTARRSLQPPCEKN